MDCVVYPTQGLNGVVTLPGDKSISHRALLFAAMANGESKIENFLLAGVTKPMLDALEQFGVPWEIKGETLSVEGKGIGKWKDAGEVISCGNSATTIRLLAGAMAANQCAGILDGSDGLRKRPMNRIVEPMQKMGVNIQSTDGHAPLIIGRPSSPIKGMRYELPVASAQVKTCLILSALAANEASEFIEPAPSRDHTERMLKSMGVDIQVATRLEKNQRKVHITVNPLTQNLKSINMSIPSDISSAAFFIVAALITPNSQVTINRVGLNPTRIGLLEVLDRMGADCLRMNTFEMNGEPVGDLKAKHGSLNACEVNGEVVVRMIDEFPIFGVAAAYAHGETVVSQAEELRYKESDRITMLCQELTKIGVDVKEERDGFRVYGKGKIQGGEVEAHGDHRLAMALMVAGLAAKEPVCVHGAEVVGESLPDFIPLLRSLGAEIICKE
ncbi:MAG: 3-phosphoshikimate 1-carboxyvinyltransferase [Anaerolineales bacterium]